jgi:autoinducer 2 (AI-2) kinase
MFDLAARGWSERVIELCGLDPTIFPPVVESGTVVGAVTDAAAAETGLRPGTPVVTGGADTQLGLLGIGVSDPGRFTIVGGTFWQHTIVLDEPRIDPSTRLRTLCHVAPDRWMMEGIGFYSGAVMRWFRDAFCELEQSRARERGVDAYTILEEQAADLPPGAHGVVGLFSNLMQASEWAHGPSGFLGFDVTRPAESGRAACVRAIEESAAFVSLGHLRIIEEVAGLDVHEAVLTAGAAKGRLWPQIVADTLGIPVRIPVVKESSALGAAISAGVGVGLFEDAREISGRLARIERTVEPDDTAHSAYQELYGPWLELIGRTIGLSNDGLVRPLWRAPGI